MNKKITVCLSYYNQGDFLRETVQAWTNYSKKVRDSFSFIIVDDNSNWCTAMDALGGLDMSNLDIRIYRVTKDLYCNISGARNLAAKKCETEWMFIVDMDTWVTNKVNEEILSLVNLVGHLDYTYKFKRKHSDGKACKPHPAACLIKKENYWKIGGCNEDLVGKYSGTDIDFWAAAQNHDLSIALLDNVYLISDSRGRAPAVDRLAGKAGWRRHDPLPSPPQHVRFPWEKVL